MSRYVVNVVNPSDRSWTRHKYVLWFGAYGWTRLMVWANNLDSALEECAEWLAAHAPGHLTQVECEADEADMTYTESGWIPSWEWGICLEDPKRSVLMDFMAAIGAEFSYSEGK